MILLILIPFLGEEIASTYRWIRIGLPIGFQPSEFAKWIVVIALARYLSDHNLEMNYFSVSIAPIIIVLIPASIVLNQPDLACFAHALLDRRKAFSSFSYGCSSG